MPWDTSTLADPTTPRRTPARLARGAVGYDLRVAPGGRPEGDGRPEADLGVVEPQRLQDGVVRAWRRSGAWFTAQPLLAQLFLGLAGLDVLVRALGFIGPPVYLDLGAPASILNSFLPHDLLIVLPALIVIRHRTAPDDAPSIVDGALIVALAELLSNPSTEVASRVGGFGLWAIVAAAIVALQAVGWIWIGRGLTMLGGDPSPTTAGWANLAAFGIVATVIVTSATFVIGPGFDLGTDELNQLMTLNYVAHLLAPLALAYVGRSVIRGADDERRPEFALRLGSVGVLLAAGLGLALGVVTFLAVANVGFAEAITAVPGWSLVYWIGTGGAISLLVLAFGFGLAGEDQRTPDGAVTLEPR